MKIFFSNLILANFHSKSSSLLLLLNRTKWLVRARPTYPKFDILCTFPPIYIIPLHSTPWTGYRAGYILTTKWGLEKKPTTKYKGDRELRVEMIEKPLVKKNMKWQYKYRYPMYKIKKICRHGERQSHAVWITSKNCHIGWRLN